MKTFIFQAKTTPVFLVFVVLFGLSTHKVTAQDLIERAKRGISLENNTVPNRIAEWIATEKQQTNLQPIELFEIDEAIKYEKYAGKVKDAVYLLPTKGKLEALVLAKPQAITLNIPVGKGTSFDLELAQVNNIANDFVAETSEGKFITNTEIGGVFYRGIVKGKPNSIVALSVFPTHVRALISDESGNYVLAELSEEKKQTYVLYNDKKLLNRTPMECLVNEETKVNPIVRNEKQLQQEKSGDDRCMKVFVEADFSIYSRLNKSDILATAKYVQSLFNESAVIYQNEEVVMELGRVFIWTNSDPYSRIFDSFSLLSQFATSKQSTGFNGNIAHLLSARLGSQGIADAINGICGSPFCFSGMRNDVTGFPEYSEDVEIFTHEMGHLMGSFHTHGCYWNTDTYGDGTTIDDCGTVAGSFEGFACFDPNNPILPAEGGTIMSYCSFLREVGINFSLGFGPQPGDIIRFVFNNPEKGCSTNCEPQPNLICRTSGQAILDKSVISLPEMRVFNIGDVPANPTQVGFFISQSPRIFPNSPSFGFGAELPDYRVGQQRLGAVNTSGSAIFTPSLNFNIDSLPKDLFGGSYFVGAYPDHVQQVNESNKGDNGCLFGGVAFELDANLICSGYDAITFENDTITISNFVITNQGPFATGVNFLSVILSQDSTFNFNEYAEEDYYVFDAFVGPLLAGASDTLNLVISLKETAVPVGDYFVGLLIDYFDFVPESNEDDNIACAFEIISITNDNSICSGIQVLDTPNGTFSDGSGEGLYADYANCVYLIDPAGEAPIRLTFSEFSTESFFDYVYVFDGSSFDAPLLAELTGDELPEPITSTSGSMLVAFFSDFIVNDEGWTAAYETIVPTDLELAITSSKPNISVFQKAIYTFEVKNTGENAATNVVISQDMASGRLVMVGGSTPVSSAGTYNPTTRTWTIDVLAPGASATLAIELFNLTDNFNLFAQVESLDQDDVDAIPGNGACCEANEDDEAVFTPNLAGLANNHTAQAKGNALVIEAIQPNPVTNKATVTFTSATEQVTYKMHDVNGKTVMTDTWNAVAGVNQKTLDISNLAPGVYYLQINATVPQRIVKL